MRAYSLHVLSAQCSCRCCGHLSPPSARLTLRLRCSRHTTTLALLHKKHESRAVQSCWTFVSRPTLPEYLPMIYTTYYETNTPWLTTLSRYRADIDNTSTSPALLLFTLCSCFAAHMASDIHSRNMHSTCHSAARLPYIILHVRFRLRTSFCPSFFLFQLPSRSR